MSSISTRYFVKQSPRVYYYLKNIRELNVINITTFQYLIVKRSVIYFTQRHTSNKLLYNTWMCLCKISLILRIDGYVSAIECARVCTIVCVFVQSCACFDDRVRGVCTCLCSVWIDPSRQVTTSFQAWLTQNTGLKFISCGKSVLVPHLVFLVSL